MPRIMCFALIGIGSGKIIISASGYIRANANAMPSTAPDAPTNGPTCMPMTVASNDTIAAPSPQYT